jgi:hypothetical protein
MTMLLEKIRAEIGARMQESRAAVDEYERLEAALAALGGPIKARRLKAAEPAPEAAPPDAPAAAASPPPTAGPAAATDSPPAGPAAATGSPPAGPAAARDSAPAPPEPASSEAPSLRAVEPPPQEPDAAAA